MDFRSQYKFGRTLGAGTYGIVREAECGGNKFAIKIILKKNVKGNEKMVYDEMVLLQRMKHPHIVRFHDWFESKVRKTLANNYVSLTGVIRTSIILSPSWLLAANYSTESANTASLRRKMPFGRSGKSSRPSTTSTTIMLSIEVGTKRLGSSCDL